jgi:hypothetical protein
MAISTVDVVTNVVSGVETPKNATCVVFCQRTGEFQKLDSEFETSLSYNFLENKYTNRFDQITYYTLGGQTVVGG